jgi:hypothetical protein
MQTQLTLWQRVPSGISRICWLDVEALGLQACLHFWIVSVWNWRFHDVSDISDTGSVFLTLVGGQPQYIAASVASVARHSCVVPVWGRSRLLQIHTWQSVAHPDIPRFASTLLKLSTALAQSSHLRWPHTSFSRIQQITLIRSKQCNGCTWLSARSLSASHSCSFAVTSQKSRTQTWSCKCQQRTFVARRSLSGSSTDCSMQHMHNLHIVVPKVGCLTR